MEQSYEAARQKLEETKRQPTAIQNTTYQQSPNKFLETLVNHLRHATENSTGTQHDLTRQFEVLDVTFRYFFILASKGRRKEIENSAIKLAFRAQENCRKTYKKIKNHSFKGEQTRQKAIQSRQEDVHAPLDT